MCSPHGTPATGGLHPTPALGSDPDSSHAEQSWAVAGLTDAQA